MKKKLIYQSWHRGLKEADLILGPFADKFVPNFSEEQLDAYARILEIPDQDLLEILYSTCAVPQNHNQEMLERIIGFIKNTLKS